MSNFINDTARPEIFNLKTYVPGKPIEEVKRELGLDDIIKMASNENPLGGAPKAIKAISENLDKLHIYPDSNCYNLKSKLVLATGISEPGILVGNGSDELFRLISETFLNKGDEVIFAQPTFAEYEFAATIMGAKCVVVPVIDFKHDLKAMLAAINEKTKLLYICNPNNPTGSIVSGEEIKDFMDQIPDHVLVIFDEAYYEYVENASYQSGLSYVLEGRNAIVLRTFSKIYGLAALRVGYALTTPEIASAIQRVTEPFNVNMMAQIGATAAIDDKEHVAKSQKLNAQGKKYLYSEFTKMGLQYIETDANFIFVDTGRDCREVFNQLLRQGVIIRTGDIFGYPTFIRVTIGTMEDNQRFITSLKHVLKG
ncbi:MAG: histidinol-phosphate transaminase [Syntrophomonadaceae bacterium]|nr:histidinol-phosphate transaminase [Syntrophomonadaceae bacterium]MDD3889055.1 histidinol-phosphate transaminase [Syntrophomonadaceae bacterium]MDD4549399.1 histidinol-phosphate transaminase [Syntrophomonadaceae bacterium]